MYEYSRPETLARRLQLAFEENFQIYGEIGASVSVFHEGKEIFSLSAGQTMARGGLPWTKETLVPVFSATKGPASACVLMALNEAGFTPEAPVGDIWPGFPLPSATIAQLLSHQCGLAALDVRVPIEDHDAIVSAINRQTPAWIPPKHGYHPRMFGPIAEELVRRLASVTLGEYWETRLRQPMNLEFWIGLPESMFSRVARLYPGRASANELREPFYKDYLTEGTLIKRAFHSPVGYLAVQEMNKPAAWTAALPALGGVGTAAGLAGFYQACLGTAPNGCGAVIPASVRQWMNRMQANGMDEILRTETAFSCGFMMDPVDAAGGKLRHLFGPNNQSFGHPGAGGSIGLADPVTRLSFAYTMNQMELGVLPGQKTRNLLMRFFSGDYGVPAIHPG